MSDQNGSSSASLSSVLMLPTDRHYAVANLLGFSLGFLFHGVYFCSFVVSVAILHQRARMSPLNLATKVFFGVNTVLFLTSTLYTGLNVFRILQAFVWSPSGPIDYLNSTVSHWENIAFYIFSFIMMNIGDALVIFRCYVVWARNVYIVLIPIILVLASIGFGFTLFIALNHPTSISAPAFGQILKLVSIVHFAQNVITTGLIILRIWLHHHASSQAGVRSLGTSLSHIARIIVESAMIYTLELLLLIVLEARSSAYSITVNYVLVPTIGLVFNLIAARVYLAHSNAMKVPPSNIFATVSSDTRKDVEMQNVHPAILSA